MACRPLKRQRDEEEEEVESGEEAHSSLRKGSTSPLVVFAHGADASSSSEWIIRWKKLLQNALNAVEVVTFDYPFISGGKRRALPKAEELVEFHSDIVRRATEKHPCHPLVLVGKSMGARVSCMVAAQDDIHPSAIVCLGYHLKVVNGAVRDEALLQLYSVRVMFVLGSRDTLCPLDMLGVARMKMKKCFSMLHIVDGGDHSLKIGKKLQLLKPSGQVEAEEKAATAIADFVLNRVEYISLSTFLKRRGV